MNDKKYDSFLDFEVNFSKCSSMDQMLKVLIEQEKFTLNMLNSQDNTIQSLFKNELQQLKDIRLDKHRLICLMLKILSMECKSR